MPYQHQEFPKWLYHRDLPAVIVNDPDEQAKLGYGWAESPEFVGQEPEDKDVAAAPILDTRKPHKFKRVLTDLGEGAGNLLGEVVMSK